MKTFKYVLIIFLFVSFGCRKELVIDAGYGLDDWTEASHSSSAEPDYTIVFPQDKVNRLDITIEDKYWQVMQDDLDALLNTEGFTDESPVYVPCQVYFEGKQWYDVGIRFKGNSSLRSAYREGINKLPLRLEFDHFDNENEAINGQTFYGFSQLSLGNNFRDVSLLHEKIATDVYRDFGVPCSQSAFYRIYIDHGEGPIYFGLYTMVEIVFDEAMLNDQFGGTSGNCYKPDGDGARLNNSELINSMFFPNKTFPDAAFSDIHAFILALLDDSRIYDAEKWRKQVESVFDVDLFLKWLVANTTMQNWDTYGQMTHNYYLYNNPSNGLLTWIPWDNNETFSEGKTGPVGPPGEKSDSGCLDFDFSNLENTNPGPGGEHTWPLIRYIYDDPVYRIRYNDYLREFLSGPFERTLMNERFTDSYNLIQEFVTGTEGEQTGYRFWLYEYEFEHSRNDLIDFIAERHTEAQTYLNQK